MTLEEARNAYMSAFNNTMRALKELEVAQAAEKKAREAYKAAWDKYDESTLNGKG